ncbi:hypothetical protein NUU61_001852 [Penicillium alfredii]|uniref:HAD-like domain-containing protein n=1 Tax=Penicillium alfredii TaxID=1506179 RepID=A0A9W9KFG3_9EURO|nr:uncharacterized protein NUU61_001852 [Penicillium alfredii]KAJ5104505.1 hypothetical protein NUU61_001852 [Penicillium alfredii]
MADNSSLQSRWSTKKWFGFDLDNTLHTFRHASARASTSVFEAIRAEMGSRVKIASLRASYKEILRSGTAHAFTDGRSSAEYRRERFAQLLQTHQIAFDDAQMEHLLDIYRVSLQAHLTLKPGALDLLRVLRGLDKKVIVVTEGPADAQEWTVRELGLWPWIDVLVTTNEVGKAKVDGLFGVVLDKYHIKANEMVYFGDHALRDVQAAAAEGILAVLYDETQESQLDDLESLRVDSWVTVQNILVRE